MSGEDPGIPRAASGRPLTGMALESALAKAARVKAAEDHADDIAALARLFCRFLARETRMSAPDAMAALGGADGQDDALRCLRLAGMDPGPQRAAWRAQAPAQTSKTLGGGWQGDAEHHPDVTTLIAAGRPMAEVSAAIAAVRAQREDAAAAQGCQQPRGAMWQTRDGRAVLDDTAPGKVPQQTSNVHVGVPGLGSEDVPAFERFRPPSRQPSF